MKLKDIFWQASLSEIKQGYAPLTEPNRFECLFCGFRTEPGRIYPIGESFFDAESAMRHHIQQAHGSPLEVLLQLDKRWTGLTELQTRLILLFAGGVGDQEIARFLNAGSVSTIRNHRFLLREKVKQARIFLAIGELMETAGLQSNLKERPVDGRAGDAENQKILNAYFPQGTDGPLSTFPTREKRRLILLKQIASRFAPDRTYNEKEVNSILGAVYEDHVLLRRLLIDYGFLTRRPDGSEYRVAAPPADPVDDNSAGEDDDMTDRKKELTREYKETPRLMGVFQVKNTINNKLFLVKAMDIPGIINRHKIELQRGIHRNRELQAEWNQYGANAFSFDVLATLKPEDYPPDQWSSAVADLFKKSLEKLSPFGEAGYHKG